MSNTTAPDLVAGLTPDQVAYYGNRRLLWRNTALILLLTIGWFVSLGVVNPLLTLKLKNVGFNPEQLGRISAINSWAYCFLVIYFAWKSDHTVTRFGRRLPYLFIAAPFIILPIAIFPFVSNRWLLLGLFMTQALFMDVKAATIPLLNMDCVPRHMLARFQSLTGIVMGALSFLVLRQGMKLSVQIEWAPYVLAAIFMTLTTLTGGLLIKEPPVHNPATEPFRPWSGFKVALADKRVLLLMLGVGLIWTFACPIYGQWIWIIAEDKLGLTRDISGKAQSWGILLPMLLAFPVGWFTDRFGCTILTVVFWILTSLSTWWCISALGDAQSLAVAGVMIAATMSLYGAVDIMVYRNTHPKNMGAVTSTNSSLRQLLAGASVLISGWMIQRTHGNYNVAFIFGWSLSTLGFLSILVYWYVMRRAAHAKRPLCD